MVDLSLQFKHGISESRIIRRTLAEVVLINRSRVLLTILVLVVPALAQREPVLKQINEPHPYYYREMYLPQLTTGPSWVTWAGDSQSLIYSMAGSLWKQQLNASLAEQLTAGSGYDYQPDCSRDGRWVVYASYQKDAIELWTLDLQTKETRQLTKNRAVNVEPRFSPDGKRIAFVSTSFNGRFHIFFGTFADGALTDVERLTGENKSTLPRYYYSAYDHEISPVWTPDGSEIVYVSNRGHIYGTGGFWRTKAEPGAEAQEIHYEETTWKARPDISPDGTRLIYSSYLGQAWNQLWVMPARGGDPFPLSYGDFDNINPRWSPDGKQIAFISNRSGNTSLWVQRIPGGAQTEINAKRKRYLKPVGHIAINVIDSTGHNMPARVFVTGEDGRAYAPDDAWMRADDNFNRKERPFEAHYFHTSGHSEVMAPAGRVQIEVMKGFEYRFEKRTVLLEANEEARLTIRVQKLTVPQSAGRWVSSDVHVHMNYGGQYRDTPKRLVAQAAAENLSIVQDLVVNKEQRISDISYFRTTPDPASTKSNLLIHGQEFHTSYWGHLGLLDLQKNFIIPDYAGYPGTAAASLVPTNADVADMAHQQQGLVGYVHPFDTIPDPAKDESLTHELPVDVALHKVDYIEVVGFSDHKSTANVWYRLLNLGFRLPTAAGTDAMANFSSLRGPVGMNRVYAQVPAGPLAIVPWLASLKTGKTFATNGPLIRFTLDSHAPGDEVELPRGGGTVKFTAWLGSIVPVDHFEIVCNGQVTRDLKLTGQRDAADVSGTLPVTQSGWCVLRAFADRDEHPILDAYPYATTSPIYINVPGSTPDAKADAKYFMAWIDRLTQAAQANKDWNTQQEKERVLEMLSQARRIYEQKAR
jgi:TolB protein